MNIATIRFTAKPHPSGSCKGCLCVNEPSVRCRAICNEALKRGLPDCDDATGYIYVLDESDPRQMSLVEGV